jgi:7-keto-8-aminopelargonate synthetase-like enzyme
MNGLMTEPAPLQQVDRTYVQSGRRKLSYFAGCDYFRLASHPAVLAGARAALEQFGLNVAASRMTTGNHALYQQLERELARFFAAPAALLVSSGYMSNLATLEALSGQFSRAFIDEKAHPALFDATRFLGRPIQTFRHRRPDAVARLIKRAGPRDRILLLTDGMFAGDGQIAPLKEYLRVLPRSAMIVVDDAHGAGTLGAGGKGTPEFEGVSRRRLIQNVTLSKAFGAYGGAILCSRALREQIMRRSRFFTASTPLPLPLAGAALAAIGVLRSDGKIRKRLEANVSRVKEAVRAAGMDVPETPAPILSIPRPGGEKSLRRRLLDRGIFPSFIRYPGGPADGCFRFVISSEHTPGQLNALIEALRG